LIVGQYLHSQTLFVFFRSRDGDSVSTSSHYTRGVPGEIVSAQDASLLELRPLRAFRVGEIVAYEEPLTRAPSTVPETGDSGPVSGAKAGTSDSSQLGSPAPPRAKIYAKIISVGSAADEGLRRMTIKTGTGVRAVLSTDVFTFKSARECNTAKAASAAPALKAPTKPLFTLSGRKPAVSAADAAELSSSTVPPPTPGSVTSDATEVSRAELLGAVNGLLVRAGVPMDLEQQVRFLQCTNMNYARVCDGAYKLHHSCLQGMVEHILDLESSRKRLEKELAAER
jgi:hypothetical protein